MADASPLSQPSTSDVAKGEFDQLSPEAEREVGITVDEFASVLLLDTVRGFGPQKFKELHEASLRPIDVLLEPQRLPTAGKRGQGFRDWIAALGGDVREQARARAVRQIARAHALGVGILTHQHDVYPPSVYASNNPVPYLYVLGDPGLLVNQNSVACVGSREIATPYAERHQAFATNAAAGRAIVSGFAVGADAIGHRAAHDSGAATILVMPCGLDRPFPPENRELWKELKDYQGAVAVSEFALGTPAATLTLRKRNKLIVALASGVLVSQSSATGGAMNAYRFAMEQRKAVATFASDGTQRTSGNELIAQAGRASQATLTDESNHVAAVFPADHDDPAAWNAWLRELSSST